jgi:hypothetical protein
MSRQEFTTAVAVEIVKRATDRLGFIRCECCGCVVKPGGFAIDHIVADALKIDKRRKLTASDGQLLCSGSRETCHSFKTGEQDQPAIARAKRLEAAHVGVRLIPSRKIPSRPFPKFVKPPKPALALARGCVEIARRFQPMPLTLADVEVGQPRSLRS